MGLFRRKQVSRFYLLRNEDLVVYVNNLGAELMSVKDAKNKTEYIWNGDPEYWGRRSPILFPFVGALNGQLYRHKGREYLMPRHGFARDMIFSKSAETEDQIWFVLDSDEKTKKAIPLIFIWRSDTGCVAGFWKCGGWLPIKIRSRCTFPSAVIRRSGVR